jgi:transcriptional regulator with XRE-family HTH domain
MTGNDLREKRKELGLNQGELAEKVGVALNTVSRWEIGEMAIPSKMLELALKQIGADQKKKKSTPNVRCQICGFQFSSRRTPASARPNAKGEHTEPSTICQSCS